MRRIAIQAFLEESKQAVVIDVRSPAEYQQAHLPGAVSLPLFTDEERAVVGTLYKQESRQAAIKKGLDFFGPRMRPMVEAVEKLAVDRWPLAEKTANNEQRTTINVFVYCWRGGMRSGAVAWLLNLYGFEVTVLTGGYKSFRRWVLDTLQQPFPLRLLGGYTGSGKTALLQTLRQQGEPIIDLEDLASHKGSAFGNLGLPPQPSQEMFENKLALALQAASQFQREALPGTALAPPPIWMEDESQRIGHVNIPPSLWETMRRSPILFLDIPFDERLRYLVQEYGGLDRDRMIAAIQRIAKRLGPLESKTAIQLLQEGKTAACFSILLRYYDKQYRKGLHNREELSALLTTISCETVSLRNAALLSQAQMLT